MLAVGGGQRDRDEATRHRVAPGEIGVGDNPQRAVPIEQQLPNGVIRERARRRVVPVMLELAARLESMIEAATRPDPKPAGAIVGERAHRVVAEPVAPGAIRDEIVVGRIVASDAPRARSDPEATPPIGMQRIDVRVGDRARGLRVGAVGAKPIAVPAREPALTTEPEEARSILGDGRHGRPRHVADTAEDRRAQRRPVG